MLIYNYKKEFIGIDESDLKKFGLSNLEELKQEALDFADLFLKVPGYIHNFKSIHWIDFINSADSLDENKVIISVNNKNYKANIEIKSIFLVDSPSKQGYSVELLNLRELTKEENDKISVDIAQKSTSVEEITSPLEMEVFKQAIPSSNIEEIQKAQATQKPQAPLVEKEDVIQNETPKEKPKDEVGNKEEQKVVSKVEEPEEKPLQETKEDVKIEEQKEVINSIQPPKLQENHEDKFANYKYEPKIAADELGLPLDLIEEFVQDFILQARDFKSQLYTSLENGDFETFKSFAHKLKGVASNLRIEDAFDALIVMNTSNDLDKIKHNLDKFYNIILPKLSDEESLAIDNEAIKPKEATIDVEETKLQEEPPAKSQNLNEVKEDKPFEDEEEQKIDIILDDEGEIEEESDTKDELQYSDDEDEKLEITLDMDEDIEELEEDEDDELEISLDDPFEDDKIDISLEDEEGKVDTQEDLEQNVDEGISLEDDIELDEDDEEITLDEDDIDLDGDDEISLEDDEIDIEEDDSIKLDDEEIDIDSEDEKISLELEGEKIDAIAGQDKIDLEGLSKRLELDVNAIKELLLEYIDNSSELLLQLQESINQQDDTKTKHILSQLKGMSDSLNFDEISKIYEEMALNPNESEKYINQLQKHIEILKKEL